MRPFCPLQTLHVHAFQRQQSFHCDFLCFLTDNNFVSAFCLILEISLFVEVDLNSDLVMNLNLTGALGAKALTIKTTLLLERARALELTSTSICSSCQLNEMTYGDLQVGTS